MAEGKQRVHKEWFMPLSRRAKKCSCCGVDATDGLYAWGNYINGKWHTIHHFCRRCYISDIIPLLKQHSLPCGCTFQFMVRSGYSMPSDMKESFDTALNTITEEEVI